jgi:hypothetical protein
MATLDEIGEEKQRISERLARLDAELTKLGDQLNELEIAERVLTRFGGKAATSERRRRGRPATTAPAAGRERSARGGQQAPTVSLSAAILKAVQARGEGATPNEVLSYLAREFGMTVRRTILASRCNATRSARKPRSALVPAAHGVESSQGSRRDRLTAGRGLTLPTSGYPAVGSEGSSLNVRAGQQARRWSCRCSGSFRAPAARPMATSRSVGPRRSAVPAR